MNIEQGISKEEGLKNFNVHHSLFDIRYFLQHINFKNKQPS